jgi:hypothetical protein
MGQGHSRCEYQGGVTPELPILKLYWGKGT